MLKKYSSFLIAIFIVVPFNVIILILLAIFLLPVYKITKDEILKRYIENQFLAVDQSVNAVTGGSEDETISSRLGRNYRGTFLEKFVDIIFGNNHCENALEDSDDKQDAIIR